MLMEQLGDYLETQAVGTPHYVEICAFFYCPTVFGN